MNTMMGCSKPLKGDEGTSGCRFSVKSQRGMALVIVLVLAAVSLTIMTALIYMITSGTQISGMTKNYKTAVDAGLGGHEVMSLFLDARGESVAQNSLIDKLNTSFDLSSGVTTPSTCTGTDDLGVVWTGFAAKLRSSTTNTDGTSNWTGCDSSMVIDPNNASTYDVTMTLGQNTQYKVYAKVVDTQIGNTSNEPGAGGRLVTRGVVHGDAANGGKGYSIPYLYTIEVDAERSDAAERAKLQILYQY